MSNDYRTPRWREAICADCLRNVIVTNVLVVAVATGIAWMLWTHLHSRALIVGTAILTTGVIIHEFIRALHWHRHE